MTKHKEIKYLVECYFHQDWDIEGPTPLGIIDNFTKRETLETSSALLMEIESLLSSGIDEQEAERLWMDELESMYDPAYVYEPYDPAIPIMSYVEWFKAMRDVLKEKLSDAH